MNILGPVSFPLTLQAGPRNSPVWSLGGREINKDHSNEENKGWYLELSLARESATITLLAETQKQARESESFIVSKGEASSMPQLEIFGMGS